MDNNLGKNELISQYQYTSIRKDLSPTLDQLPSQTYFYYSEGDQLIDLPWFNQIRASNTELSVISTSGSGHMLPLEKPRELAEHINAWITLA
ncbi:hypothetical protein HQQ94_18580 [Shewanella sp. VB17]|uniref:alpha/beta fold hydrolase n=1 Tax=Shewanella sp. VB17 TaxID=2739432 RepID=UPI00156361DF|nr:hypothetical protein [Shewanella sp. VB17]NRD75190.1 hypothetical protein [Shewanella sp. VB17]